MINELLLTLDLAYAALLFICAKCTAGNSFAFVHLCKCVNESVGDEVKSMYCNKEFAKVVQPKSCLAAMQGRVCVRATV